VTFQPYLTLVTLKAQLVFEKLFNLGGVCYFDPPAERLDAIECLSEVTFGVTTDRAAEVVCRHFGSRVWWTWARSAEARNESAASISAGGRHPCRAATRGDPESRGLPNRRRRKPAASAAPASPPSLNAAAKAHETLRVDIDRLDDLMNPDNCHQGPASRNQRR
jgi:hypothetical protein